LSGEDKQITNAVPTEKPRPVEMPAATEMSTASNQLSGEDKQTTNAVPTEKPRPVKMPAATEMSTASNQLSGEDKQTTNAVPTEKPRLVSTRSKATKTDSKTEAPESMLTIAFGDVKPAQTHLRDRSAVDAPFSTRGSRLQPIYLEDAGSQHSLYFDVAKHSGAEDVLAKAILMHTNLDQHQLFLMELNREILPAHAELALDARFTVRRADNYIHKLAGVELQHKAIKRLLGLAHYSTENWLEDEVMNYYFALVAHTAGLQAICSLVNGDAITDDKKWKIDRDLIKNAIFPLHLGHAHWAAALIIVEEKRILIVDSPGPEIPIGITKRYHAATRKLRRYLESKTYTDSEEWKIDYKFLQRQSDAENCGVFACMFVKHLCLGIPWVELKSLSKIRKKILFEIERGRLLPF